MAVTPSSITHPAAPPLGDTALRILAATARVVLGGEGAEGHPGDDPLARLDASPVARELLADHAALRAAPPVAAVPTRLNSGWPRSTCASSVSRLVQGGSDCSGE